MCYMYLLAVVLCIYLLFNIKNFICKITFFFYFLNLIDVYAHMYVIVLDHIVYYDHRWSKEMFVKLSTILFNSWGLLFLFQKYATWWFLIVSRIINCLKILNADEIKRILIWFDQKRLQQVSSIVQCWQVLRDFVGVPIGGVKGPALTCALIIISIVVV